MAGWDFPTSLEVGGTSWDIHSDFRAILGVMDVLADDTITDEERAFVTLSVFYVDYERMPPECAREAIDQMMWFIRGGQEEQGDGGPRLIDWDQDFHLMAPPINRVLGYECRSCDYLHWWTFLGAYMEIGECYFQQVVAIRSKKAKSKKLDKSDEEFYRKHKADVDLRRDLTKDEQSILDEWLR